MQENYDSEEPEQARKSSIIRTSDSLIFLFDEEYYGYFLDEYDPNITEHKFRMRSLIFVFHRLDFFANGFKELKHLHKV